jgi:hypothetical protein
MSTAKEKKESTSLLTKTNICKMEQQQLTSNDALPVGQYLPQVFKEIKERSSGRSFINANTVEGSLYELNNEDIIPVFSRDNQPLISQAEFIDATMTSVSRVFHGERILEPSIKVSHQILERIPDAKNKSTKELLPHERTRFWDRMAFVIEIPSIFTDVAGNRLNLTVGGVQSYSMTNLMSKTIDQPFKVFCGFQNSICLNLCISSDGLVRELRVNNLDALYNGINYLFREFNAVQFAKQLQQLPDYELSEAQFAHLVGRARLYRHMPDEQKKKLPDMMFGDAQINSVCRDYYADNSFCRNTDGSINLWNLYNLFTGANKSSYIDSFLDRSLNALQFVNCIKDSLDNRATSWYLN